MTMRDDTLHTLGLVGQPLLLLRALSALGSGEAPSRRDEARLAFPPWAQPLR